MKMDLESAQYAKHAAVTNATTKHGHEKARAETLSLPVRLDFGVIFEHVQGVIHDLSHHEALIDVGRILGQTHVQQTILENYGDQFYKQIRNAIRDIAFGTVPATSTAERAFNHFRVGGTIVGLAWNVTTSILQPLGLANSMVRIGPTWVARGIGRWIRNPTTIIETVKWIESQSPMMRSRARTWHRDINEVRNSVGVETGKFSGWVEAVLATTTFNTVTKQGIADSYFWMIQQAQRLVDVPTWLGAYEKYMAAGELEERAIALADQAVLDSQGGGQVKDLAEIQRGTESLKLWTSYYSYFSVVHNQAVEAHRRSGRHPVQLGRELADYTMLFVVPASLSFLVHELLRPTDDEPDELALRLLWENISYAMGTLVYVREIPVGVDVFTGYEGPAGARIFSSLTRLSKQASQLEADPAFFRALAEVAGIVFHLPAGQAAKTAAGIAALVEGDTTNPAAVIGGPPRE